MTSTEFIVIVGGLVLGYWLVAVVWPLMRDRGELPPGPLLFEPDPPWHEVLGIAADADGTAIAAAYQAKRDEYSPERIAGLGHEGRRQAQLRVIQIDRAYAAAMRELGTGREDAEAGR
ncbi:hypothetical protein ABU614_07555 [Lysobacter firmicutimachus]|uniref:J domain-containing protein n=1 Tax=Lysobacter firmicutimachus TaxID=1792846 RepID=A0AAU8MZG9_9GAMM